MLRCLLFISFGLRKFNFAHDLGFFEIRLFLNPVIHACSANNLPMCVITQSVLLSPPPPHLINDTLV